MKAFFNLYIRCFTLRTPRPAEDAGCLEEIAVKPRSLWFITTSLRAPRLMYDRPNNRFCGTVNLMSCRGNSNNGPGWIHSTKPGSA